MNWDDLKDSSEYAEAVTLVASLIAAIIALRKAEKEDCTEEKAAKEPSDGLHNSEVKLKLPDASGLPKDNAVYKWTVAGLCFVAVIQLAIILFIAYRLM